MKNALSKGRFLKVKNEKRKVENTEGDDLFIKLLLNKNGYFLFYLFKLSDYTDLLNFFKFSKS